MPRFARDRCALSLLLVVAVATGTLPAVGRACHCPAPVANPQPVQPVPSCCGSGSCCTGSPCCDTTTEPAADSPCSCNVCGCESPAPVKPDSAPPPAPVEPNAAPIAIVPLAPILPPALPADAAYRLGEAQFARAPVDLVILLERLTC